MKSWLSNGANLVADMAEKVANTLLVVGNELQSLAVNLAAQIVS